MINPTIRTFQVNQWLRWSSRWKMGIEMERHVGFVRKSGVPVSRLRMNLLGSYFISGYFKNLKQFFALWWLLPVFSYTAQTQNHTHVGTQHFCLKPCFFLGTHWSFGTPQIHGLVTLAQRQTEMPFPASLLAFVSSCNKCRRWLVGRCC